MCGSLDAGDGWLGFVADGASRIGMG